MLESVPLCYVGKPLNKGCAGRRLRMILATGSGIALYTPGFIFSERINMFPFNFGLVCYDRSLCT